MTILEAPVGGISGSVIGIRASHGAVKMECVPGVAWQMAGAVR
jgi:hypothetical protein